MRRLFHAFPEVVMVDCTHSTNRNKYILFSFVIHDIFGKGQYVNHSLLNRESMDNMDDTCKHFKKNNPRWDDIRAFVVDKDYKERHVLRNNFPKARILLCYYHVIKYFAKKLKQLVRGTMNDKVDLLLICRSMVYAKCRAVYEALKLVLARYLGSSMAAEDEDQDSYMSQDENDVMESSDDESSDEEDFDDEDDDAVADTQDMAMRDAVDDAVVKRGQNHRFYRYFMKNWETCQVEWVLFHRQNVAHLGNHTNNRIEAKWGGMKRVVTANMDIEESVRTIRTMQAVSEDEYLHELTLTGTRLTYTDDAELSQLLNTVSDHAYKLVLGEYTAVKEKRVHYSVRPCDGNVNVVLCSTTNSEEALEHTVHIPTYNCDCFFAQCRLLPCRHVLFYRSHTACETMIPFHALHRRWSLRNPANNISLGDKLTGRLTVHASTVKSSAKLSAGDRFCKAMTALKPIASLMSTAEPATFDRMLACVAKVAEAFASNSVPSIGEFTRYEAMVNEARGEEVEEDGHHDWEREGGLSPHFVLSEVKSRRSARTGARILQSQRTQEAVLKEAKRYMKQVGRTPDDMSLYDVHTRIVMNSYAYVDAVPVICGIPICKTKAIIVPKRSEYVTPDAGTVRYILRGAEIDRLQRELQEKAKLVERNASQATQTTSSDEEEDAERQGGHVDVTGVDNEETGHVVCVGDGKGYLSVNHVFVMARFMDAVFRVNQVVIATEWLKLKLPEPALLKYPFDNFGPSLDQTYLDDTVKACENMILGSVSSPTDEFNGCDVLEIVSDEWLHTTSVLAILAVVWSIKDGVGMIRPEFVNMKDQEQRHNTIGSNGAFRDDTHSIIAIVNLSDSHWSAFFIDKPAATCWLYDPLAQGRGLRLRTLRRLVEKDVAPHLYKPDLAYRTYTELSQDDGASCGVYCGLFLEIMLRTVDWSKDDEVSTTFFRARYMRMISAMAKELETGTISI